MDDTDPDARHELIGKLFYLLTARAEDAAGIAAEGQVHGIGHEAVRTMANRLESLGQEITIVAEAVRVLTVQNS